MNYFSVIRERNAVGYTPRCEVFCWQTRRQAAEHLADLLILRCTEPSLMPTRRSLIEHFKNGKGLYLMKMGTEVELVAVNLGIALEPLVPHSKMYTLTQVEPAETGWN